VNFTASATGVLKSGGYIVATFPSRFTTASTNPTIVLTSATGHFDTYCTATGVDATETNVVVITLADASGQTCKLANSTAASFTVSVINGPAGTYGDTSYSLYTSMDSIAAQPTSGSETIVAPSSSGTNWTVASNTFGGEATAEGAPAAPGSVLGGATGGFMCTSSATEEVELTWSPVALATSYVIEQATTANGVYSIASPAAVYSGTTATITYTTSATEYYEVEAVIGNWWVSASSTSATNGSLSPGFVVIATTAPECTNN
jgi:exopolysaccharide biosynthesis protein